MGGKIVSSPKMQLSLQTSSLIVGFMVWVILSSLMPYIQDDIALTPSQMSWVTAVPVILGSLLRIPIGFWTNRFGARIVFAISFILLLFPVYYISTADTFSDLIIGGLFIGIGGAVFSVGVTSLPKYYPKEKHGLINGIYGAGNIGTAITSFAAPVVADQFGWKTTVLMYLFLLAGFAVLNFLMGDRKERKVQASLTEQIKGVYKSSKLWFLCLFYFITFGSFVAFTVFLPNFLVNEFQLEKVDAGFRTAIFIAIATVLRPLGGWLGDKFNPYLILFLVFFWLTFGGFLLSFNAGIVLFTIGCLLVAACAGIGNGTVFKLVPLYFSKQAGVVNGIVAAMGGLGGFFPPLILTALFSFTGHYAIGFMALSEFSLASLIIVVAIYFQDKLKQSDTILENAIMAVMVTDESGNIKTVNQAFTEITGYTKREAIGKRPNILKSGRHDIAFYNNIWSSIESKGYWQGDIWNKRKNGEEYQDILTIQALKEEEELKAYIAMYSNVTKNRENMPNKK